MKNYLTAYMPDGRAIHVFNKDKEALEVLKRIQMDTDAIEQEATKHPPGLWSDICCSHLQTSLFVYYFGNPNPKDNGWQFFLMPRSEFTAEESIELLQAIQNRLSVKSKTIDAINPTNWGDPKAN